MMIKTVSISTYYGCCLYQLNVTDEAYNELYYSDYDDVKYGWYGCWRLEDE